MSAEETSTPEQAHLDDLIIKTKEYRVAIDQSLQLVKSYPAGSREHSLCITKLQEAVMWLGMELKRLGNTNPYPDSYKPENAKIAPTADGLTL